MMKINSQCRDCKSMRLKKFLDLGKQPLANSFVKKEDLEKQETRYPLEVYLCQNCNLVQLIHVVDKDELFGDYIYFSSKMPQISPHWQNYAKEIIGAYLGDSDDFVFEIASNDGILLKFFKDAGFRVLGMDPAKNIASVAESLGVPTLVDFFSEAAAREILKKHGFAKTILANNVVAHIDDHHDLCRGVRTLLHPQGVFVIEAPYLVDMFENLRYDTVYHEHLSFLAVRPLVQLFDLFDLEIFNARVVPIQGQSLRLFVGHKGAHETSKAVNDLVQRELDYHMDDLESYNTLAKRVEKSKEKLIITLKELKSQGKIVAAYGAPAKGNTILNYCQIGSELIDYARDDLPSKQGLYSPGMHIPIVSGEEARQNPPDYYLVLAWNYMKTILDKEKEFIQQGGKFILPIEDDISI